ncbi:hypothetical protein KR009_000191 [Drosophila setifemur]|nr:hypothetical protein KR009_000191 [Drosophila setifemur]
MKATTLCLLVLVSATCLLTTQANPDSSGLEDLDYDSAIESIETELEELLNDLEYDSEDGFMDVEQLGFISGGRHILRAALKTIRGGNCIISEVKTILTSTTDFMDTIEKCGSDVPRDVKNIVKTVKQIQSIGGNILHMESKLCAKQKAIGPVVTKLRCFWKLFRSTFGLFRRIHRTVRMIAKLPAHTSSCFLNGTTTLKVSFTSFIPNINTCIKG